MRSFLYCFEISEDVAAEENLPSHYSHMLSHPLRYTMIGFLAELGKSAASKNRFVRKNNQTYSRGELFQNFFDIEFIVCSKEKVCN